jgi:hypothetical protein
VGPGVEVDTPWKKLDVAGLKAFEEEVAQARAVMTQTTRTVRPTWRMRARKMRMAMKRMLKM